MSWACARCPGTTLAQCPPLCSPRSPRGLPTEKVSRVGAWACWPLCSAPRQSPAASCCPGSSLLPLASSSCCSPHGCPPLLVAGASAPRSRSPISMACDAALWARLLGIPARDPGPELTHVSTEQMPAGARDRHVADCAGSAGREGLFPQERWQETLEPGRRHPGPTCVHSSPGLAFGTRASLLRWTALAHVPSFPSPLG